MAELHRETCEALTNCRLVMVSLVLLSNCQTQWASSRSYRQEFDMAFTTTRNEKVCKSLVFGKDSYQQFWSFLVYNICTILESWMYSLEVFGDHLLWPSTQSRVIANTWSAVALFSQVLKISKDRDASSEELFQCYITFLVKRGFRNTHLELYKLQYVAVAPCYTSWKDWEQLYSAVFVTALQIAAGTYYFAPWLPLYQTKQTQLPQALLTKHLPW